MKLVFARKWITTVYSCPIETKLLLNLRKQPISLYNVHSIIKGLWLLALLQENNQQKMIASNHLTEMLATFAALRAEILGGVITNSLTTASRWVWSWRLRTNVRVLRVKQKCRRWRHRWVVPEFLCGTPTFITALFDDYLLQRKNLPSELKLQCRENYACMHIGMYIHIIRDNRCCQQSNTNEFATVVLSGSAATGCNSSQWRSNSRWPGNQQSQTRHNTPLSVSSSNAENVVCAIIISDA